MRSYAILNLYDELYHPLKFVAKFMRDPVCTGFYKKIELVKKLEKYTLNRKKKKIFNVFCNDINEF